ncbi:MAG: hypothetical protein ACOZQL_07505 [Myxococcota bacterium]
MRTLLSLVLFALPAVAAPRDFPFTWTSSTANAGEDQLEAWATPRLARTDDFLRLDTRLVWTHGVTRTVESQLSMDLDWERTDVSASLDPKLTSLWRWTTWRSGGPFAAGGLGRVSLARDLLELEGRLFADLRLGRVLMALNFSGSTGALWAGRTGVDTRLEESFAIKVSLSASAAVGLEVRGKSSWQRRDYQGSALYLGPALTWTHPSFWVSLGGYAQVASDKAPADKDLAEKQELRDNERFVLRLTFGAVTRK